jgi:CheY-like chemotaxis protein
MNILILEDDRDKFLKIKSFLFELLGNEIHIINKRSYNSSLVELSEKKKYDFVLMDMSMPTYDSDEDFESDDSENFAGKELLEQMKFRKINYPTIVITQYDTFGNNINKLTLDELIRELKEKFESNYLDTIYYSSSENDWKYQLNEVITKILKKRKK